jgi:hypothetical protein
MMGPSGRPLNVANIDKSFVAHEDDASDITPSDTRNVKKNQHEIVEKVIKFRFVPQDRADDPVHPALLHIQWIREVQESLGSDIDIYDNKGKKISKIDPVRWTNMQHEKVFNFHRQNGSRFNRPPSNRKSSGRESTFFVVHRICTSWTGNNFLT